MKRLALLFVFVFSLKFMWAYDFKVNGIYYKITSSVDKTVAVTYGESLYSDKYQGHVVVPNSVTYSGVSYDVTSFYYAFYECYNLTALTIPSSIKSTDEWSFKGCSSLQTINITDLKSFLCISGLSSLYAYGPEKKNILIDGEEVFTGDVVIPEGVTIIPQNLLYWRTNVTSIKLPDGLEEIGAKAFFYCSSVKELNIPASVSSIGNYSFTGCTSLKNLYFEDGVESLSVGAKTTSSTYYALFEDCPLDSVYLGRNLTYKVSLGSSSDAYGFSPFYENKSLRALTIGNTVTAIDKREFHHCPNLETVHLGKNVTSIGEDGFNCCYKLRSIVLPEKLKTIEYDGFYHCDSLRSVVFNEGLESIGRYAFAYCRKLESINMPSTLQSIGSCAFSDVPLTYLTIPANVTTIGSDAFSSHLKKLVIEDSSSTLTFNDYGYNFGLIDSLYIGRNYTCKNTPSSSSYYSIFNYYEYLNLKYSLVDVEIGDKVTSLPDYAFYGCQKLETLTLGSGMTKLGTNALYQTAIKEIKCTASTPPTLTSINFSGIPVYVASGSGSSYRSASGWKNCYIIDPADEMVTVNLSMPGTLEGRLRIQGVTASDVLKLKVTGEMNDADWAMLKNTNMSNLYYLDLSEVSNTSIPEKQFQSHKLVTVVLPSEIENIDDYAFDGCTILTGDYTMPSTLTKIGDYAFKGTKVKAINLASNIIVGNYAFNNSKLETITLNKCTSIGQYAFAGCSKLKGSYALNSQLTEIPDYAFSGCSAIEAIELPQGLKTIGNSAFNSCSSLTSIEFHNQITSFGSSTSSFAGCTDLTSIKTHWQHPISAMSTTFASVDKSKCTLYVPKGSTDWYLITTGWDEFVNVVEYDDTETLGDMVVADATDFNGTPGLYSNLSYTRNYSNTKWQSLYVPFAMKYEDWKDEYDVAYINSVRQYDDDNDGTIDRTIMDVLQITSGELYPNKPYLIKAKTTGEKTITLQNATLYATEENSIECSTMLSTFTFTGTYSTIPASTLKENGYYAMGGGGLIMTNGTSNLKPFRWYMGITSRSPMYNTATDNPSRISVHVIGEEDDMETSLYGVAREEELDDQIFNLNGQMIDASEPLAPGLYIKNGKKVIIR